MSRGNSSLEMCELFYSSISDVMEQVLLTVTMSTAWIDAISIPFELSIYVLTSGLALHSKLVSLNRR